MQISHYNQIQNKQHPDCRKISQLNLGLILQNWLKYLGIQSKKQLTPMNAHTVDTDDTLRQVPPEYYHKAGPLIPNNTPLSFLQRHIHHQEEIDNLLKTSSLRFCVLTIYLYMSSI